LQSASVHRLRATFKEVRPQTRLAQADLEKSMSSSSSHKIYREALQNTQPPAVPYLGLLMTDLIFVDENPDFVNGHLINWSKRTRLYELIEGVLRFQSVSYNLQRVPQICNFIMSQPTYTESELYRMSTKREARKKT